MKLGEVVHPDGVIEDIGTVGTVAITLYTVSQTIQARQV
jgi:SpoU rRNA methylase family enzyme